jgi:putative ubiquitin-RnfH superfamily antitoxin RatB of RatAB toxin-antitoxin module
MLQIEIAWATDTAVQVRVFTLPAASTLAQALERASTLVPQEVLEHSAVAVFGRRRQLDEPVYDGDRIELLGPLTVDPKQARRRRVDRQRAEQARDRWNPDR